MAILKPKSNGTKTVSFRLPADVIADLDAVKREALERGLTLDLSTTIERLVVSAIKQARAELDGIAAPTL